MFRGRYWSPALPLPSSSSASLSLFKLQTGLQTLSSSLFPLRALTRMTGTRERKDCRQEEERRNGETEGRDTGEGLQLMDGGRDSKRKRWELEDFLNLIRGHCSAGGLRSQNRVTQTSILMVFYCDASVKFESLWMTQKPRASPSCCHSFYFFCRLQDCRTILYSSPNVFPIKEAATKLKTLPIIQLASIQSYLDPIRWNCLYTWMQMLLHFSLL